MATPKKLKVGDPVLFYGKSLTVSAIENGLAVAVDAAAVKLRGESRSKILALREQQANLKGDAHDAIARQIGDLDKAMSEALFTLKLRADLLTWWDDRGTWVSDGRILSDDQKKVFVRVTGRKPPPDGHRDALAMIESLPLDQYLAHLNAV